MQKKLNSLKLVVFFSVGCGGGGAEDSGLNDDPPSSNEPPSITAESSYSITENKRKIGVVQVRDPDSENLNFSIEGPDSDQILINSEGQLLFAVGRDFEEPSDADLDNVYSITLVVSDGQSETKAEISIEVLDALEQEWDQNDLDSNVIE